MRKHCAIERRACEHHGHHFLFSMLGIVGGLYLLGKREQAKTRLTTIPELDNQATMDAWLRVSRLPQFRFMREYVAHRAVLGRRNARVLDIGSGAGQLSVLLAQQPGVAEVTGIDLSDRMVKQARQTAEERGVNASFLQVDAAQMPFPDNSFDIVVSTLSLHHWSDAQQVLREIKRVLAPGGRAMLFDLRRDASPVFWGVATMLSRYIVPRALREVGEPLTSFQAAYTPCEAILLAVKSGWSDPCVTQGPIWMMLELQKNGVE